MAIRWYRKRFNRKEGNKGRSEEGASSDLEPGAARLTASGRNGVHEKPVGSVLLVYPVSHARVRAGGAAGRPASPATPRLSPGSIRVIRVIRVPGYPRPRSAAHPRQRTSP